MEIGLIIVGAFYFVEVAENHGVIRSLSELIHEVTHNRVVQSILVAFPLCLIVEGSSGFGTPLLMIAPILRALGLPILLCALLPLVNMINGIPFGALGTPIRLGFSSVTSNLLPISESTIRTLIPFFFYTPLLSFFLIRTMIKCKQNESKIIWVFWTISLSLIYASVSFFVSKSNVEFPVLAGALVTLIYGIYSAHFIEKKKLLYPKHRMGLFIYTLLLFVLWIGKTVWMDEKIPGTPVRIFNPGWVFILFGIIISKTGKFFKPALVRSRRTISVLFCMTFIVQQLKVGGKIQVLLDHVPQWFLQDGVPLLGWLSSYLIGTGTIANLFVSPLIKDSQFGMLAASTAIGVPLAFQSIIGVKSILKDAVSEKEILNYFIPISVSFLAIILFWCQLIHH